MSKVYDQIRYSNCWEDADLLLDKLDIKEGHRVLSIGSAGDNSFSALVKNPAHIQVIDLNPHQIELIALKIAAFKTLEHEEFLGFLGFRNAVDRSSLFEKVSVELPELSILYWKKRMNIIRNGIIYTGKFDRYLRLFARRIIPLIHSKRTRRKLLEKKTQEEQSKFFSKTWNTAIWRLLFKVFFSRKVMSLAGRHPSFFDHVEMKVSDFILNQTEKHFTSVHCQNNHFLHYILFGEFGTNLPHYARKENYELIRSRIDRLSLEQVDALHLSDKGNYDIFNLSNIFEYLGNEEFYKLSTTLAQHGKTSSQYAYWNLMVSRELSKTNSTFTETYDNSKTQKADLGFFYKNFIISQKQ
jgi:S-adenosylmethionine-diacylglycerol 3-amino-3-carboxypropyl transferase